MTLQACRQVCWISNKPGQGTNCNSGGFNKATLKILAAQTLGARLGEAALIKLSFSVFGILIPFESFT